MSLFRIWDTATGQTTHTLTQGGAVNALQFSESRIVSAGADHTVKVSLPSFFIRKFSTN